MKSILITALMLLSPAFAQAHQDDSHGQFHHLSFKKANVHAHCLWSALPAGAIENKLQIEFKETAHHSATAAPGVVSVTYGMPSMPEMSNPGPVLLTEITGGAPGVYEAKNIWFTMAGAWVITVTLTMPDGTVDSASFNQDL